MRTPKSLAILLKSAEADVARLRLQYDRAAAREARLGDGPSLSEKVIAEAKLRKASSWLNCLKMQSMRERREAKIAQ